MHHEREDLTHRPIDAATNDGKPVLSVKEKVYIPESLLFGAGMRDEDPTATRTHDDFTHDGSSMLNRNVEATPEFQKYPNQRSYQFHELPD